MPDADLHLDHYADALLSLGHAAQGPQALCDEFSSVARLIAGNEQISRFLSDPKVNRSGKRAAIEELLEKEVTPAVLAIVLVMQAGNHLACIEQVAELLCSRISSLSDKIAGELVTAAPLSRQQVDSIAAEASRILNQSVDLRVHVDSNLLGGARLRIGSFVLDGTVDHQLEDMRDTLLA